MPGLWCQVSKALDQLAAGGHRRLVRLECTAFGVFILVHVMGVVGDDDLVASHR